jgi:hypothetical protein
MVLPGDTAPQSMVVRGTVQLLSEYTLMFADVAIDPEELRVLLTEIAPYVVSDRTNPAKISVIIVAIGNF